jgi:hypothetical protein
MPEEPMGSKEFIEFINAQACLPDDCPYRTRLEVPTGVHRDGHRQCGILRMNENMVASNNTIDDKSGPLQRSDDAPPIGNR